MKKSILILSILAVLALVAYNSCAPQIPSPLLNKNTICMNYDDTPISSLKKTLIDTMVNRYRNNKKGNIEGTNISDSHSIWFDLETLKAFIYHIETKTKDSIDNTDLGIRIYYADYPEQSTWSRDYEDLRLFLQDDEKKKYAGLHTLIMIPTRRFSLDEGKFKDVDIDISNINTFTKGLPDYIKNENLFDEDLISYSNRSIPSLSGVPFVYNISSPSVRTGAQNHGSMIPPMDSEGQEAF